MAKKKKLPVMKKPVKPQGVNILDRGFINAGGRMIGPGGKFADSDVSPKRLAELKDKGLIRGVLTTEEKGTFTK